MLFKTALILFTNQASIAFDFDHELGSPEDIKASLKSDIKFGGGSSLFPFTNASSAYELATRQILQPCSGRGCRGFRDFDVPHGKLCVFDEAHKYLSGAKSGGLSDAIVDTVRQMRHYGLRVAISTQSPTALPAEVLELTTVAILHRFHSRDWFDYLSKKIPLPTSAFEEVQHLGPGEALVYAETHDLNLESRPTAESGTRSGAEEGALGGAYGETTGAHEANDQLDRYDSAQIQHVFKVQMRRRLTADGGASRTNRRQHKRRAAQRKGPEQGSFVEKRVEIFGLTEGKYNGQTAMATSFKPDKIRYICRLDSTGEKVSVKAMNLRLYTAHFMGCGVAS